MTEINDDWIPQRDRFSQGNAFMKRPTRPFVVEVKKKRGSPAKPRSIWGDLDLSALAADPSPVTALTSEPVGNDPDPAVEIDRATGTATSIDTRSEDGDAHAVADAKLAEPHPAEVATNQICPVGSAGNVDCQKLFVCDIAVFSPTVVCCGAHSMAVGAIFEIGASVGLLLLFEPDIELGLPAGSDGAHAGARRPFGVEVPM